MRKILFLLQLPPPFHGASIVNKYIQDSFKINNDFSTEYLNISPARQMDEVGNFSIIKALRTIRIIFNSIIVYSKFKPDLTYLTLSPHGPAFLKDSILILVLKIFRSRICIHLHGKGIKKEIENTILKKTYYKFIFKNTHVIHLSEKLCFDIDGLVKKKNIYIVNNGVKDVYNPEIKRNDKTKTKFLFLSNFVPEKGAHIILDAIQHIPIDFHDQFELTMCGKFTDSIYRDSIINKIKSIDTLDIKLHEGVYGNKKDEILNSCDVFILPTFFKNECFPLSIIEAMSANSAIISTNEGAISDFVIKNINGFLIEKKNPLKLAFAMTKLIKSNQDLEKFKYNSRDLYLRKYTLDIFFENLANNLRLITED